MNREFKDNVLFSLYHDAFLCQKPHLNMILKDLSTVMAKLEWTPSYFTISFFTLLPIKIDKQNL